MTTHITNGLIVAALAGALAGCGSSDPTSDQAPQGTPAPTASGSQALASIPATGDTASKLGIVSWRLAQSHATGGTLEGVDAKGNVIHSLVTAIEKETEKVTITVVGKERQEALVLFKDAPAQSNLGPEYTQVLMSARDDIHAAGIRDDEVAYGCGFWGGLAAVTTCVLAGAGCAAATGATAATAGLTTGGAIIACGVGATYCAASIYACA
jgi:hypothetical protein